VTESASNTINSFASKHFRLLVLR